MSRTLSVLDSLMWKNPEIQYEKPTSFSLTNAQRCMTPRQLLVWDEFNFETLRKISNGRLIEAAQQTTSLLSVCPYFEPCVVTEEPETQHVITAWNYPIVQAGLTAIGEKIPTCKWNPSTKDKGKIGESTRSTPTCDGHSLTTSFVRSGATGMRKGRRYYPDSGATVPCHTHGSSCPTSRIERLPKDYKSSTKWRSSDVLDALLEQDGTWQSGMAEKQAAWPIRQAYTYCVWFECRYGCILTTEEAFIFRIKPRKSVISRNIYSKSTTLTLPQVIPTPVLRPR